MKIFNYLLTAAMICSTANAFAQTSGIDLSFGEDGIASSDINGKFDDATDLVVLPDGDILVAGNSMAGSHYEFMVSRFNSDGSVDESFGENGNATIEFSTFHCLVKAMAVQEDGKIVLVGNYDNNYYTDPAIARFNSDGTIDTGFGGTGFIKLDLSAQFDDFNDVVIQPDGKILVAGSSYKYGTDDFLLVRFLSNGSFDEDFGNDGFVYTDFSTSQDIIYSLLLQADKKIVVSGYSGPGSFYFAAARYFENGLLDPTFSIDGKMTIGSGSTADKCFGMAMQSDSSFILAGNHHSGAIDQHMIARIDKFGILDPTFGTAGVSYINSAAAADLINDVTVQPDNKIVLCGVRDGNAAFIRLNKNGLVDNTFGTDGIITPDPDLGALTLRSIVISDDASVIACGSVDQDDYSDFMLMKITVDIASAISNPVSAIKEIRLYPNPAVDQIQIEMNAASDDLQLLMITDMNGRVIYQEEMNSSNYTHIIHLPASIRSGSYLLTAFTKNGTTTSVFQVVK